MTESAIIERLDSLTAAVQLLAQVSGARLTRAELAARLATAGYNAALTGGEAVRVEGTVMQQTEG